MTAAPSESDPRDGGGAAGSNHEDSRWRKDFRLLLSGSVLSQLGTLSAAAANPLLALALTGSPIVAGWVAAASTLPGLLLHLPVGLIVDRFDRLRIMLFSQTIRMVNSVVLVVGLFALSEPWLLLILAAVIDGSCAVFFRIAEFAAVRFVVPDGERENAMGKSEARHHLALVLGRPVGGMLFAAGRVFPYAVDALTSFISVFSLIILKKRRKSLGSRRKRPLELSKKKVVNAFREGFSWISRDRFLSVSLVVCAIANTGFQIVILLLVVEAQRREFSGSVIGMMLGTSGVAGFFGAITAPGAVRRLGPESTVRYCVVLWIPFLVVVATAGNPLVGLCAWGVCSFFGAYINVALAVYQGRTLPSNVLGRVEGVIQFLTTGAVTLGAFAGGYVIAALGIRPTAILVTIAFVAIGTAVLALIRNPADPPRRTPTRESPRALAEKVPVGSTAASAGGDA